MRDRHMREKIFTAPDGSTPELRFHGENIACPLLANGAQATCEISGLFSLRGVSKPVRLTMRLRPEGSPSNYRATADGSLRLSEFGIEPPSQLGIHVNDEVAVRLEFVARRQTEGMASR
jgi:polyisoprenoid-binding protein YceI